MTGDRSWAERFPGFDVLGQRDHWDDATAEVVLARVRSPGAARFFTPAEEATALALCAELLATDEPVPFVASIDARLADDTTDGWHHEDMPCDGSAWRASLRALDEDAQNAYGCPFSACDGDARARLVDAVRCSSEGTWHGLPGRWIWSLWTRYACTAFFSHPSAWNEIGFPGPAYPRGYKHATVGGREPFEVRDRGTDRAPGAPG
jgi:hypothetical protein